MSPERSETIVFLHGRLRWRVLAFVLLVLGLSFVFSTPLGELIRMANKDELFSYIPLIPLVSAFLFYWERSVIFHEVGSAPGWGLLCLALGAMLFGVMKVYGENLSGNDVLAGCTGAAVLCLQGCLLVCFGSKAFQAAAFPLFFLLFMVPIPSPLLDHIVSGLQVASAEAAYGLFKLTGVPIFREGFIFHLPGMSVEVAKQCSGIRSSVSLFITGVLASHFVLRTGRGKALAILSVVPITVFKNALRIITLSLLAVYVDPRIMSSALHKAGGIPFFALAISLFGAVLWLIRRWEARKERAN